MTKQVHEVERRTVYGRTMYCVMCAGIVVARCDEGCNAHRIAALLNKHEEWTEAK